MTLTQTHKHVHAQTSEDAGTVDMLVYEKQGSTELKDLYQN